MNKRKLAIGGTAAAVILVAVAGFVFFRGGSGGAGESENLVYVDSVASITGLGSGNGLLNRFGGVVEPLQTVNIKVSSDKTVKEVYVKEGDDVKKGQKLFIYDTTEAEENLASKEIEVERIKMDIETYKANVESLKKEKASAGSDEQLDYTVRIQSAENNAKKSEYELKATKQEIEQLKKSVKEAVVKSEIDGVVKSISETGEDASAGYYGGEESESFMTLLSTGKYRIKGIINEQNMGALSEGDQIVVHSRVNEDKVWKGTLTTIDMDHPETGNSDVVYYGGNSNDTGSSSNYPFYVELESDEDLILGQHVYMERDEGQLEEKEGLWLTSYYVVQEEENAYVWAANKRDRIEKRQVTLGEYDEELEEYQILDGLTEEDYIAYPDESIKEGAPVTRNIEDLYNSEGNEDGLDEMPEGGFDEMPADDLDGLESFDDGGEMDAIEEDGADMDDMEEMDGLEDEDSLGEYGEPEDVQTMDIPDGQMSVGDAPASETE